MAQMVKISATEVAEFNVLEMLSHTFIRVQFRCVGREAIHLDFFRPSISQEVLNLIRPMNTPAISNYQQLAAEVPAQVTQESHALHAGQGAGARQSRQSSIWYDPTNHRQMIARLKDLQDWCFTARRLRPDHPGQQVEGGFVDPDNQAAFAARLFFSSGQTSVRQRAISCLARWVARLSSFCGVLSNAWSSRDTWVLWYETPNCYSMTTAIRAQVQTSPRKPYASEPAASNFGIRANSAPASLGEAPGWGRACKSLSPALRTAWIHFLTAHVETSRASAISSCVQPSRLSSRIRHRRISFQPGVRT